MGESSIYSHVGVATCWKNYNSFEFFIKLNTLN